MATKVIYIPFSELQSQPEQVSTINTIEEYRPIAIEEQHPIVGQEDYHDGAVNKLQPILARRRCWVNMDADYAITNHGIRCLVGNVDYNPIIGNIKFTNVSNHNK